MSGYKKGEIALTNKHFFEWQQEWLKEEKRQLREKKIKRILNDYS